jgi:hypothetical protein
MDPFGSAARKPDPGRKPLISSMIPLRKTRGILQRANYSPPPPPQYLDAFSLLEDRPTPNKSTTGEFMCFPSRYGVS